MLRKFKITYRAVKKENVSEIPAFSKYDAKQRFRRINPKAEIISIEEVAKNVCHLDRTCDECMVSFECKAMMYAKRFYTAGYRKAEDVAREIFEAFRDEMRSLIATSKELFNECEDDYYEGKKDAFFTAIIRLDELIKKKYLESEKDRNIWKVRKTMAERNGMFVTYTADDEMPDCLNCDNCDSKCDCSKFCGAEHGWFGYRRTVRECTEGEG